MADTSLTFDIIGRDRASHAFDTAGRSSERLHGTLGKLGGVMKGAVLGGALAAGAGIAGLGALMVQGVKDAADYQTLQKATAAVLKSTGNVAGTSVKHVDELAGSLESLSGVDETLIVNSQNVLATFTQIRNTKAHKTFDDATKAALNLSVAMHEDLQSATVQVGKALNNPLKGITALARVGVTFDEGQKKQIATMMKHGHVAEAQAVILKELNKEFGGAAKAAGQGFNGAMARAKDAMSDAARNLGMLLLPMLTKMADWVATKGVPALIKFGHWLGPRLKQAWAVMFEAGRKVWGFLAGQLWPALQQGYQKIVPALNLGIKNLKAAWGSLSSTGLHFKSIIAALWPVLKVIGAVIGAVVVAAFISLSFQIRLAAWTIKTILVPVFRFMANWALTSMDIVLGAFGGLFQVLSHLPGRAGKVFGAMADAVNTARDAIHGLRDAINGLPDKKTVTVQVRLASGQVGALTVAQLLSGKYQSRGTTRKESRAAGGVIPEHVWGIGASGTAYEFGERGPETVIPGVARRGGGDVHVHINMRAGFVGSPQQLASAVQTVVKQAASRGHKVSLA